MKANKIIKTLGKVLEDEYGPNPIPVVGTIAYSGKSWTVQYKYSGKGTQHYQGYGDFPFGKFPNIPVIDLRTSFSVAVKSINNAPQKPEYGGDLDEYLNWFKQNGVNIIYPK